MIAVDLRGVFLAMKYEVRHMLKAGMVMSLVSPLASFATGQTSG